MRLFFFEFLGRFGRVCDVCQDLMATESKFCFASPAKHDRLYHEWAEVRPSRGIQSWLVPVAQCGDTVGLDGQ